MSLKGFMFPRTASGKIDRKALAAEAQQTSSITEKTR